MKGSNSFRVQCLLPPWAVLNNVCSVCVKVVFAMVLVTKKDLFLEEHCPLPSGDL